MSLVVHKLVLSPGGAAATTVQPPTTHHVTLSAYTHARSNATDNMGRVLDGPPSGSMSTPPASSSPYSSSSSNSSSSSSSKHSSTYNLPFVLQDHNYGAPPPPTPPHSPPPTPSSSNTSSSSSSLYQHPHHYQHQQQQQHQYHHHNHHHHQTYQSTSLAPSSSSTSHHHTPSSTLSHHHQHLHQPTTTNTATLTPHHHHHHRLPTPAANTHHHPHHQQHQHHATTTTTSPIPHLQQKHHHFVQHPGPSPRLRCSSSATTPSSSSSSSTNTAPSSAASFSSPSLSVGGVITHHPLSNMPPHRQQFMPHPKSNIIFPSPHIPPPPVELPSLNQPQHHQSPPSSSSGPTASLLPSTETDDDSRLSDRSSSVGPSGEETETAPEGEGDDLPADDSITRCVCDFSHDDGYMIQCDRCFVWQHVDCMEIDRDNIPDEYLCEACDPRSIDRFKARALQIRRRQEIKAHLARLSSSDSEDNIPMSSKSRGSLGKVQERKVVKKKKVKQIKDMKNGRKSSGSGSLLLLKKGGGGVGSGSGNGGGGGCSSSVGGSSTITATLCNNSLLPGLEDKDRRMLVKRRRKSNSLSGCEGVSDDSSGGPVERLRAWVEGYEAAVTNHYSPELRARVHAARINGVSPDLRASTQGAVLGHRCRVVNNPQTLFDVFDSKILVAATRLAPNTAITEFQGKYLLASQWNAQQPVSGQPYLPYVLQYHMPKEGLTVCVDARTYGNDARFTRHSCTPNAEVRHVVERGSLHLYIVASQEIEEGEEVTLALETANSALELVCCLADEHDCRAPPGPPPEHTAPPPALTHKKNGLIVGNKKAFKKQQLQLQLRTSKRTASAEPRLMESVITPLVSPSTPVTTVKQRRASGCGKSPVKSPSTASASSSPEDCNKDTTITTSGPVTPSSAPGNTTPLPDTPRTTLDKQQQQKMTREERKIAAYMKAFERLEKAAQRRQEMDKKKEEDKGKDVREPKEKDKKRCDGDEEDWEKTSSADECARSLAGLDRCRRKGKKARGKGSPQKRSNHRADSAASDLTGDESSCASVGLMSPGGGATIESIALNFNSPPQCNNNAMGFRFPKTKKALMNEWLNENVDPVVPAGSVVGTDLPSGVPPCYMRSPAMPLRRSSLNQTTGPGSMPVQDMSGGSAKKRWLRQAISEETEAPQFNGLCPSPNSRPDSPTGGGDYITPLKKRRLARESMSSELSSTPPSTPVHSTSLEEEKMVEEMEAELAEEEDSHKPKINYRYSEDPPTSPCIQDTHACAGFLRSTTDTTSTHSGWIKRVVQKHDEEDEEEDLVIDEGGSFFEQGRRVVHFSKVACGQLSQDHMEEDEEDIKEGRGVIRGKTRRGKKICYTLQEEDEESEREEDDEEENHEEEKDIEVDDSEGESVKPKRRLNILKKGSNQEQQQAAKRGKKQQGGKIMKGKQDLKIKAEVKRRKPVKRCRRVTIDEEKKIVMKEAEDEKETERKEDANIPDNKPELKEEIPRPEIKIEPTEPKVEADCKAEPKSESEKQEQQEIIMTERTVKKEEEEERQEPEVKIEPQASVEEKINTTEQHQETERTSGNNIEDSDKTNKDSEVSKDEEDKRSVDETVSSSQGEPLKKEEEEKEGDKDIRRPRTEEAEMTEAKGSSEDNQVQSSTTTASPEISLETVNKNVTETSLETVNKIATETFSETFDKKATETSLETVDKKAIETSDKKAAETSLETVNKKVTETSLETVNKIATETFSETFDKKAIETSDKKVTETSNEITTETSLETVDKKAIETSDKKASETSNEITTETSLETSDKKAIESSDQKAIETYDKIAKEMSLEPVDKKATERSDKEATETSLETVNKKATETSDKKATETSETVDKKATETSETVDKKATETSETVDKKATETSLESVNKKAKIEEESVMLDVQEETKKSRKKKEKVTRKVPRLQRLKKKDKEQRLNRKGVKESTERPSEKEDFTSEENKMMVDAEKDDRHAKLTEPVFEDKEQCPLNNLRERSRSPSSLANKEQNMDKICREKSPTTLGKSFLRSAREDSPVQSERRTRDSQTPTKDDLTTMTSPLEKVDGNTATTPEPRWKLDLPMKPIEHPIEILRKPPTPPTLFPPLPWQTNPENFSDNDPLRPKTPDNVNYLGVKGPRTPEGPAPTSPSNSSTSSHPSPLRSPFAIGGGSEETKGEDRRAGENAIEGSWRPRARGPCTPPSPHSQEATPEDQHQQHQQQEGGEEAGSSPSHHYPHSNSESTQKRNAPVKKKLSILEYRKRKSVGGEAGPLDSSPPPCPPSHRNEFSLRGGPHSPSSSSPPGLMGGSGEDGDSSPDLPLSPMGPILLPPSPINFDTRSSLQESKREGESNRSSAAGTASSSDLNKHSLINKNMSSNSNNSSSNTTTTSTTTTNSSSNSSNTPAVSEASTSLTATTTSTSTTTGSHSLHTITGGSAQDVKWNAAPTLLERQRENLTARLRREFGLCVADDDEDKSGLRLNCSGMLSRPTPPLLSPTTPLATTSPLSRKPPVLTVGPACMSYLTEGDERTHRRHKSLLPPPPPPPPTAQPKNSIFHGREVIEPKVLCGMKVGAAGPGQPAGGSTGGTVVSGSLRLMGSTGLFPPGSNPSAPPSVRGTSLPQIVALASAGIPIVPTGAVSRPCPVPPPMGVPPVPTPALVQAGMAVLPAVAHGLPGLPGLPPSKQPGSCLSPALVPPQQNPEYPGRPFPRGQFGAPGMSTLTSSISLFSAARLAPPPPPPPPLPPQTVPAGPSLQGPIPPGHANPARVGGEGSAGYSGQDCPAPGTRGS